MRKRWQETEFYLYPSGPVHQVIRMASMGLIRRGRRARFPHPGARGGVLSRGTDHDVSTHFIKTARWIYPICSPGLSFSAR